MTTLRTPTLAQLQCPRKAKIDKKDSQNMYDKLMSEKFPNLRKKENSATRKKESPQNDNNKTFTKIQQLKPQS